MRINKAVTSGAILALILSFTSCSAPYNPVSAAESVVNDLPGTFNGYLQDAESILDAAQDAEKDVFHPGTGVAQVDEADTVVVENHPAPTIDLSEIPDWSGEAYVIINGNVPMFDEQDLTNTSEFLILSEHDALGRCQANYISVCPNSMPEEDREEIGMVRPSGWQTTRYDDLINGKYLYNRCHLIGFQLSGLNSDDRNLITGTRYLNLDGQLPFENAVASYVRKTGNHVLYRVTPIYDGSNLVASGVLEEAYSVEDAGEGIQFCVYCYNIQPGVVIDYADGTSHESVDALSEIDTALSCGACSVVGGEDPFEAVNGD